MEVTAQALIDALSNQRNAALNELARTQAMLSVALAEVDRLTSLVTKDEAAKQAGATTGEDSPPQA